MVSYEALLFSKDMQPAVFQEDTIFSGWWCLEVNFWLFSLREETVRVSGWVQTEPGLGGGRVIEDEQGGWRGWPSEQPGAKTKLSQQSLH